MARGRTRYRRSSQRRRLVWARTSGYLENGQPNAPLIAVDLLGRWREAMGWESAPGITVRRTLCNFLVYREEAANQDANVQVGLIRWNQDLADVSAGEELPNPDSIAGAAADWMGYKRLYSGAAGGTSAGYDVDVKSQRKLEEMRQTIWMQTRFPSEATTGVVGLNYNVSLLLALP